MIRHGEAMGLLETVIVSRRGELWNSVDTL
jgi:hypothetical protein